jgi:alginate O-acetyltransferase complex protein AlgI
MVFNSLNYFLFLPVVFFANYFSRDSYRWLILLVASFVFYAALKAPHLILVLLLVTTISFFTGIWIDRSESQDGKRYLLWGGIAANVLVLAVLKYLSFLTQNLNAFLNLFAPGLSVPLSKTIISIGVSYFVFQAISYLIDIYLEIETPERHFGHFTLYMSFFPKILQGPIERGRDLLPQLKQPYVFNYDNVKAGMILFAWGLFKKVVIADRLGFFVNTVYDNVQAYTGLPLLLATWLYAFQLYFDFSGYTDMALGTARMFNVQLTQNFNSPYLANSVADFWRRWHISFTSWILDYIFKPLQMKWRRRQTYGTAAAVFVTFLISGIWHGAAWGFIVWGGLHGLYLSMSLFWKPYQKKLYKLLKIEKTWLLKVWQTVVTFQLVCFAWIFFRATSLNDAKYVVTHLFSSTEQGTNLNSFKEYIERNIFLGQSSREFCVALLCLVFAAFVSIVVHKSGKRDFSSYFEGRPLLFRWAIYYALLFSIIVFAVFETSTFIYYKF